jgi:hypothetical protein
MEVRRTVPAKLDVDGSDADRPRETIQQFLDVANYVVDAAYEGEWVETRTSVLQEETYSEVRERTDLHSNHVQSARDCAVDALTGTLAKWTQGNSASLPTFTAPFCEYNHRNATFHEYQATLATVDGRVTAEYILPDESDDSPHSQYLLNDDYETTRATLHDREGSLFLHVRTKADVDALDLPEAPRVGVPMPVRLRLLHGRGLWTQRRAGDSTVPRPAVFDVRVHTRRQPLWEFVLLSGLWVREPRGLQRSEEHRSKAPSQPDWKRGRRTRKRAREQRDGDHERRSSRTGLGSSGNPC